MTHEILTVKLCELEDSLSRLNSRIRLSETASHNRLRQDIETLSRECAEAELTLRKKLQLSRADVISILSDSYVKIEEILQETNDLLREKAAGQDDPDMIAEGKILLAEYALDFAIQASNRALLLSMEAIDAQYTAQEKEGRLL